jgi:UDP-galactopyranose mutase
MQVKPRIVILGGGLSGLSLAYFLTRLGLNPCVFEKEQRVGGLCKTTKVDGFSFDCCGHLLHFKHKDISFFVRKLLGENLVQHKRRAFIYSFGKFIPYPFQVNLRDLPPHVSKKCLFDFIKACTNGKIGSAPNNFLEWCYKNFGKGITEYFMLPYNEKFWTIPCRDFSYEWVDRYVFVPTLREVVEGTVEGSKHNYGYHSFFWYPKRGGIEELITAFSSGLKNVFTGWEANRIDLFRKRIEFKTGRKERYDILISTIPLPELSTIITDLPQTILKEFKKLKWVSIFNLNLGIEGRLKPNLHWVYFPQKEYRFFRVGFFHNFSQLEKKGSLYTEVSYSRFKPLETKDIVSKIIKDLVKVGIITDKNEIKAKVINDIKYAYPIYDFNWKRTRTNILRYLNSCGIISCGRFGSWRYMSMEDVILESKTLTEFIWRCLKIE